MHMEKSITVGLLNLGVRRGNLLMVHAQLKAIGAVECEEEAVIAALPVAVGQMATMMMAYAL